ncbi:MAG: hypothetical protein JHC87_09215 [Thermoleophilaceae bacterium]|nr:hypothetical protein [Thermoleophilaceae bacterium]
MSFHKNNQRLLSALALAAVVASGLAASAFAGSPALTGDVICNDTSRLFEPATITVAQGATVTWGCNFAFPHTLASDDALWTTQTTGTSFQHTFPVAGSFKFHCDIHAAMKGTVNVTAPAPPATGPTITKSSIKTKTVKSLLKAKAFKVCLAADRPVKRSIDVSAIGKGGKTLFRIKKTDASIVDTATAGCSMKVKLKHKILKRLRKYKGKSLQYSTRWTVTDVNGKSTSEWVVVDPLLPSK